MTTEHPHRRDPHQGSSGVPLDSTSTMLFGAVDDDSDRSAGTENLRELAGLPAGAALLVVRKGPNAGSRFLLDMPVTSAGRHPESDIFLDDVTVSRRHAEVLREGSGYSVRDIGSLNGTYVNKARVESSPLFHGDEVQIGKFRLTFLIAGPQ